MPGLYENEAGRWSMAGAAGMLVPVRNIEGRIVALKIRADEAGEGSKYTLSEFHKVWGPRSRLAGARPAARRAGFERREVDRRRTQGGRCHCPRRHAHGVDARGLIVEAALEVARSLGSGVVHLAFDADAKHNEQVARALRESYRTLKGRGFEVVLETWPRELGKGIDDLLASGHEPTLLAGEDAHAAVNEIVGEATGVSRILKNAVSATELLAIEFPTAALDRAWDRPRGHHDPCRQTEDG